jgi:hypothetical protein
VLPRRRLALALLAAGVGLFLLAATLSTRSAPDTYPVADTATTSLYALRAARGELTVGSYSRFGWNHPGPLLYQLLAGPYELSGRREIAIKWTALAINLVSLGATLAILGRRSPALALATAVALAPLLWREQRLLFLAWNPFVPVLALAWAMAAAADLASRADAWRSRWGLTWLVLPLSLCVQAHAGLALPALPCVLAAGAGASVHRAVLDERAARLGLAVGLGVALVLWAVPLIAEVRDDPGNLRAMAAFLADPALPRHTWARAAESAAYMTLGPWLPSWVLVFVEVPASLPRWLPWALAALVVAVAVRVARAARSGEPFDAVVGALSAAATLGAVVAARGVIGPMSDYLLLWATAAGALDAAVLLAPALRRLTRARAAGLTAPGAIVVGAVVLWGAIGGHRLIGKHAEQARDTSIRALATDLQAYCDRHGIRRPLLTFDDTAWQEAAGLVLQFAKADRAIAVEDSAIYMLGRPFGRTGGEDGAFYLMPIAGAAVPAGAGRTAWVTTRGAYRILHVRIAGAQ